MSNGNNDNDGKGTCPVKMAELLDPAKLMKICQCPIFEEIAKPPIFTCVENR
jgi:hypothetical protein